MRKKVSGVIEFVRGTPCFIADYGSREPVSISWGMQQRYRFFAGDRLTASLETDRRGRLQALPVEILQRAVETINGVVRRAPDGTLLLEPFTRFPFDPVVIETPDDGTPPPAAGAAVTVRLTVYAGGDNPARGRIAGTFGMFRTPGVDTRLVIAAHDLPDRFPRGCRAAARELARPVERRDRRDRTDLRNKAFVTIDGEDARDFDDAVAIDPLPDSGWRLYIAIADVSHYVTPGSIVDREARRRGTSVYFPDRCLPMLPEELSNGICSLKPGEERLAVTAIIEFDAAGKPCHEQFCPAVIRSQARLTYNLVAAVLAGGRPQGRGAAGAREQSEQLRNMGRLAALLRKRRLARGSLDFDLPEAQIVFDRDGRVTDVHPLERNDAHRLIEEFMLAANEAVATRLTWLHAPFLYRVHEPPDTRDTGEINRILQCFGLSVKGRQAVHPRAFQEVLRQAAGTTAAALVNRLLLGAMQKAVYQPVNAGHFGLALENYTHFTSPIRRYPDLMVHRELKRRLWHRGEDADPWAADEAALTAAGAQLSTAERRAMEAERTADAVKKLLYLEEQPPETVYAGMVSGIHRAGIFVTLDRVLADGLIPFRVLDDYFVIDAEKMSAVGENSGWRYTVGDRLEVIATDIDPVRRRLDLKPVKPPVGGRRARRRSYRGRTAGRRK
ncbi:MAG: ribonuclease R [Deltaproteobacteria bacterium]|nr:ribonuclease R [Candidatus Anaeroferrophillacea bacterium]